MHVLLTLSVQRETNRNMQPKRWNGLCTDMLFLLKRWLFFLNVLWKRQQFWTHGTNHESTENHERKVSLINSETEVFSHWLICKISHNTKKNNSQYFFSSKIK